MIILKSRSVLAALTTAGCVALLTFTAAAKPARKPERKLKPINYFTPAQVHRIERQLPELKSGMSSTQVFQTLGYNLRKKVGVIGGGAMSNYADLYCLRNGYNLVLHFDYTKKPARFKSAKMLKFKLI